MPRRKLTPAELKKAELAEELPDLTPQQMEFVHGLLSGLTASDAYRKAYDTTKMQNRTIWAEASRLRANHDVAAWLRAGRIAHLGAAVVTRESHLRELERIREIALEAGNIGAAAQCEHYRGKVGGHYVEQYRDLTFDPIAALNEIAEIDPAIAAELAKKHNLDWQWAGQPETRH